jgi:hypothetical protein
LSKFVVEELAIVTNVRIEHGFVVVEKFFEGDHTVVVLFSDLISEELPI